MTCFRVFVVVVAAAWQILLGACREDPSFPEDAVKHIFLVINPVSVRWVRRVPPSAFVVL